MAMIATTGFIISLYSSSGCQFIDIQIGFTPNNVAWNESRAELGLFYYHNRSASTDIETSNDFFYNGCIWYTDTFQDKVIDRDRTWRVSRIMAMIAVSSSLLVTLTLWMIVVTPIPTTCIWPGLLLPNTMLSFIAEGSKFLLFDIALCRKEVWYPSGVDSLPEMAEQCQLGTSAFFGIAAGVLHLTALIGICLRTPHKRTLDPSYGIYPSGSGDAGSTDRSYIFRNDYRNDDRTDNNNATRRNQNHNMSLAQDPSLLDEDIYTEGPSPSNNSLVLKMMHMNDVEEQEEEEHHHKNVMPVQEHLDYTSQDDTTTSGSEEPRAMITSKFSFRNHPSRRNNNTTNNTNHHQISSASASSSLVDHHRNRSRTVIPPPPPRISESRIAVLSKFDLANSASSTVSAVNDSNQNSKNHPLTTGVSSHHHQQQQRMIEDLLSELDTSLADERYDDSKGD
jgi:hypothetical protein